MTTLRSIGVVAIPLALACATGCEKSTTPPVQPTYRPLTTAYAPLYNLASPYNHRGAGAVTQYATLFDPVSYLFVW